MSKAHKEVDIAKWRIKKKEKEKKFKKRK